jgi:cell wall assembly regulator SMI1
LNWWDSSDRQSYEINKFLYIIAARDLIWDGLFKKKVNITLEAIALFFEALANHSYTPQLGGIPTVSDWEKFIEKWNTKTFSEEFDEEHDFWSERFPEEIKQKKCSRPPATELEVLDLEEKLGISLPTSYRNFLLCSNGWLFLYEHIEFLGTTSIDWYSAPNQKWADLYKEIDEFEISDEEYFQYGKYQDCISMRYEYLDALLRISEECEYEYALNPMVIDDRGEWEAWDLSGKHPGAFRYQSFWEMMQATYKRCFEKD